MVVHAATSSSDAGIRTRKAGRIMVVPDQITMEAEADAA
jgi:hypothetical protein